MQNEWLKVLVKSLVAANASLPIILDTVAGVTLLVKAATGSGPTVQERAAIIREAVAGNDAYGKAELERIDAILANG